jgi:hypothetical protein
MTRRHNPRLLQSYRLYTIPKLAELLRVGKNTISRWISLGLAPIEWRRPYLFKGWVVAEFLTALNQPRCRGPRRPKGGCVSLDPKTPTSANFVGKCPDCGRPINRRVRYVDIPQKLGDLTIRYEDEKAPVSGSADRPRVACSERVEP